MDPNRTVEMSVIGRETSAGQKCTSRTLEERPFFIIDNCASVLTVSTVDRCRDITSDIVAGMHLNRNGVFRSAVTGLRRNNLQEDADNEGSNDN